MRTVLVEPPFQDDAVIMMVEGHGLLQVLRLLSFYIYNFLRSFVMHGVNI